jgi:hypothetical protein
MSFARGLATRTACTAGALIAIAAVTVAAADLTDAAAQAFTEYADSAQRTFLARVDQGTLALNEKERAVIRSGRVVGRPGGEDGIMEAPDALLHHWYAAVFIPGVTLDQVVSVSRSYPDYPHIFANITRASVLADEGDSLKVRFRMKGSGGGLSATFDVRSGILYRRVDQAHAHVMSRSEEIHQVEDAERASERLLPVGHDSGYLWRAGALTRFMEGDGGVYMEMESLALSRRFPQGLGWLIEPIARRLGRHSVENSVQEFRRAVLARFAH